MLTLKKTLRKQKFLYKIWSPAIRLFSLNFLSKVMQILKGYDAIALNGFQGHGHYIILNREKMVVEE